VAIEFECEECERVLRVKDEHAGRRIKCPGCGARITIPDDDDFDEEEELVSDDLDDLFESERPTRRPPRSQRPERGSTAGRGKPKRRRPVERGRVSERAEGELDAMDWLLIVLCGGIACIVGIVACIQGDTERGIKMIVYPFAIGIVLGIIRVALMSIQ
jgi:DNA-directed RNA polymerase subunit RPC12/RpoP